MKNQEDILWVTRVLLWLNYIAIIGCASLFFITSTPLSFFILVITITWLLYNTIEEHYNKQKREIMEQALKLRQ